MCAFVGGKATRKTRARKRPFMAWKVVELQYDYYVTQCRRMVLQAGLNYASDGERRRVQRHTKYNPHTPVGIHFYFKKPFTGLDEIAVPVIVDPRDVIVSEPFGWGSREGAAVKVRVSKLTWKRLGLDVTKLL